MNREQYIRYRKNNDLLSVSYDYYIDKVDNPMSIDQFQKVFPIFVIQTNTSVNYLWDIYDIKFSITLVLKGKKIINLY
jgi:hypothetical protein